MSHVILSTLSIFFFYREGVSFFEPDDRKVKCVVLLGLLNLELQLTLALLNQSNKQSEKGGKEMGEIAHNLWPSVIAAQAKKVWNHSSTSHSTSFFSCLSGTLGSNDVVDQPDLCETYRSSQIPHCPPHQGLLVQIMTNQYALEST